MKWRPYPWQERICRMAELSRGLSASARSGRVSADSPCHLHLEFCNLRHSFNHFTSFPPRIEFFSFESKKIGSRFENSAGSGDGAGSVDVVSSHHSDGDACFLAFLDSGWHLKDSFIEAINPPFLDACFVTFWLFLVSTITSGRTGSWIPIMATRVIPFRTVSSSSQSMPIVNCTCKSFIAFSCEDLLWLSYLNFKAFTDLLFFWLQFFELFNAFS